VAWLWKEWLAFADTLADNVPVAAAQHRVAGDGAGLGQFERVAISPPRA